MGELTILNKYPLVNVSRIISFILFLVYLLLCFLCLPVTLALLFSSMIYPLVQKIQKTMRISFSIIVFILTIAVVSSIYGLSYFIIHSISLLFPFLDNSIDELRENFENIEFAPVIFQQLDSILQLVATNSVKVSSSIFQSIIEIFIFVLAFYFSLFECRKDRYWFFLYAPPLVRKKWRSIYSDFLSIMTTFITIEFRLMLITFFIISIGFSMLGYEYPITKAFFIALVDVIPFLGIGILFIPLAIINFYQDDILAGISIIGIYICVIFIRQFAESYFWSSKLKIRTIHSFFISAGAVLIFGVYGLLFIPILFLLAMNLRLQFNDGKQ